MKSRIRSICVKHLDEDCEKETVKVEDKLIEFSVRTLQDNGCIKLCKNFLTLDESLTLYDELLNSMQWSQSDIVVYGKTTNSPRMQCWRAYG